MERFNIVIVRKHPIYFRLDQNVWNDCGQVICRDLFVQVKWKRLLNDFHDQLELLQLAKWRHLLLQPACLLNCHLPSMAHLVLYHNPKGNRWQFLKDCHFALELFLLRTHSWHIKELRVQIVHYEVADLYHVKVWFILTAQKHVLLQLTSRHIEKLLK